MVPVALLQSALGFQNNNGGADGTFHRDLISHGNADQVKKEIEEYYDSEEEFFDQYGSYYSSIDDVVQQGIESEMKDVYEYLPSRARITVK